MIRFFSALTVAIYFFTWVDILIWQRIFEANELWDLGIGTYHDGWTFALFGFMALGVLFFYPNLRRMLTFPLSLAILAFCGLEDILYYWLDGRTIPNTLYWLNENPLIFLKPVIRAHLLISALTWLLIVIAVEVLGDYLDRKPTVLHLWLDRVRQRIFGMPVSSVPDKVTGIKQHFRRRLELTMEQLLRLLKSIIWKNRAGFH